MAEDNGFAMGYALGQDSNGGNSGNNGGFGGSWGEGLWAIIILAMLGFGRNGFGGFGGLGGVGGDVGQGRGYSPCATQADVRAAVDQQTLISKLDQQTYGLADSTYALNNAINNGFHGVDTAVCNLGFQTQSGFNSLGAQLASCCCDIERGQDRIGSQIQECCCDLKTQMSTNTRDIIDAQNCGTRAILDFLTNEKIDSLRAENQALRFSASQDRQNAYITTAMQAQTNQLIDRIAPYPIPSFNVCAPYQFGGYGAYGGFGFGRGSDCGCGCGC